MMNINSAIFVPQGVPPPSILSPMPHMLTFMPPPPTPPPMQGILQRIHHGQQQQQRHQQFMYQQYLHHQQQQQQQQLHMQQQQQQKQQQQIFMRQQQQQQQQKYANRSTHRMQEIQQIHQQQRLKRCSKNKPIQRRYLRPMHFDEYSNIMQMRAHQTQQMSENDPNREEPVETIEQIFSNKVEYVTFLYEKAQKYRVAEQQLQNEQKMQFQNYFRMQPQNGTKRQPLVAKYDNKKVKMQQNVPIQYDESAIRASVANKIGQNNNSSNNKQQQQQQANNRHHHGKNETNAVGQQQQTNNNNSNNNVSQQSTPNHANKSRKPRNNNNNGNQSSPGKKQSQNSQDKQGTQKVTYWLETHYHVSTTNEDNLVSCHNSEVHRNSTSSEITCSDDLNSCSSNEDMEMQKKSNKSVARHHANNNRQNKRQTKRKQNAANKQQQQQQQQNNNNNGNVQQQKIRVQQQNNMDVDDVEESKENQIPTVITTNNNHRNNHNNNNNAAHKGRHAINNKRGKNSRISVLAKEPALVKSNSNSNVNIHSSNSSTTSNSANSSPTASPAAQKRSVDNIKKIVRALVPNYMTETVMPFLQITESQFYMALQRHLVPKNLLRVYGYPVESVFHEGCVEIFKLTPRSNFNSMRGIVNICDDMLTTQASPKLTNTVNPNDSGKGSSDISPPDLDCEIVEDEATQPITSYQPDDNYQIFSQYDQSLKKKCVRCKASFHVTEGGQYVTREECVFHWGKKYQLYDAGQKLMDAYSCCNKELTAVGCSRNKLHVWNGAVMGINGPYTDFVYTYEHYNLDGTVRRSNKVFALDCEMSYTAHGLDLTKVTLINADGNIVYEKFVIPAAEIADYNTRFSGITQEDLCPKSNIALKTLPEVQRDLLEIISADTILIGHGLDNDLRALRMVHKTIVDTSVTYPHRNGFPYRLSLKHLARSYLGRNIQASGLGHSSLEDSLAALHLMYVKVQSDQYGAKAYE